MSDEELAKAGGSAFPESCGAEGFRGNVSPGMTLRDYFAAQALAGLAAAHDTEGIWTSLPEATAEQAYSFADAMLEARKK